MHYETTKVLNDETFEKKLQRKEEANEKIFNLGWDTHHRTWKIHEFIATVSMLIHQDNTDINTEYHEQRYKGGPILCVYNILSVLCCRSVATEGMSDSDQYDAIMFLLANGADPSQGFVLYWVVLRFYCDKCSDSDFVELFRLMIEKYGAVVNFQDQAIGACMIKVLDEYLYDDQVSSLQSWSHQFQVATATFLQFNGDINIQHLKE
jgi:hypothetical protein